MDRFKLMLTLLPLLVSLAGPDLASGASGPADSLSISWGVKDNYVGGSSYFESEMTLSNRGDKPLGDDWSVYFNFIRRIRTDSLRGPISIRYINGSFYEMKPDSGFSLDPDKSITLRIIASNWAIRESAGPSGFYVIFGDAKPQAINSVTIEPFTEPRQTNRYKSDLLAVVTPELRYRQNSTLSSLQEGEFSRIIPTPTYVALGSPQFTWSDQIVIRTDSAARSEAQVLAWTLEELFEMKYRFADAENPRADIRLRVQSDEPIDETCSVPGSYRIRIQEGDGIEISAHDRRGIFYAWQTLLQLIDFHDLHHFSVDSGEIRDCPRFPYRGLMIDVARYFHPAERIKQTIRVMSFYKLNKLHFHLSDDEGWRLPVASLPELTAVGGRRGHTLDSYELLPPAFGSGPDPETSNGSGFYTREEFIDILRFATRHHVEIIPEIDSPGHMRAAIKSMEHRYRRLMAEGKFEEANDFLLTDSDDRSEYRSVQGWDDNVANVCLASTFRFMETVIDELVDLFGEAGAPLTTVHLGGDEVPPGVWEKSPACDRLLASRDDLQDVHDLSADFYRRLVKYLESKGLKGAGWEEIGLEAREVDGIRTEVPKPDLAGKVIPYAWNSVWGWGGEDRGYKLANAGYQVVMANAPNLYFDFAAEKHPKEPGFAWGGFVDERKIFEMTPMDVYNSAYDDRLGHPIDRDKYTDAVRLTPDGAKNILGIQGQLWGENTPTRERFEYHLYPKMLALAERAWAAQPEWETITDKEQRLVLLDKDWNRFANRLGQHDLARLHTMFGLRDYRIPPPGAIIIDGTLHANVSLPGLGIRYTTDGSEPTMKSPRWTGPVAVGRSANVQTFDAAGQRSRTELVISH